MFSRRPIEVRSIDNEVISPTQRPTRHANTKPNGCFLSASSVAAPDSSVTKSIQIGSEVLIERLRIDHPSLPAFRIYRLISTGPIGLQTPDERINPRILTCAACQVFLFRFFHPHVLLYDDARFIAAIEIMHLDGCGFAKWDSPLNGQWGSWRMPFGAS